jgi:hypothetical protein
MMAFNDMVFANRGQRAYREELPSTEKHLSKPGSAYFIRLQMAHLAEGMKALSDIEKSSTFQDALSRTPRAVREAHARLVPFLSEGLENDWFEKNVVRARHNLTFHYENNQKLITWALADRASRPEAELSSVTVGDHGHLWRFHIADEVVDSILTRKIWHIPKAADLRKEADAMVDRIYLIYCDFLEFVGPFILEFLR